MRGRIKITTAIFVALVLVLTMLIPTMTVFADPEPPQTETYEIMLMGVVEPGAGDEYSVSFHCDELEEGGSTALIEFTNHANFDNPVFEFYEKEHPDGQNGVRTDWFIEVNSGADLTFTMVPAANKRCDNVWVNGMQEYTHPSETIDNGREFNLNNVNNHLSVDIQFTDDNNNNPPPGQGGGEQDNGFHGNENGTPYTITFSLADGTQGYYDKETDTMIPHTVQITNDQRTIEIDGERIELRLADNDRWGGFNAYTVAKNGNNYVFTITNGDEVIFNYSHRSKFALSWNGTVLPEELRPERPEENYRITEASNITIKDNLIEYTLVWGDNNKICYHTFEGLYPWGTQKINYIEVSDITDQSGNNGNVANGFNNDKWGWVETSRLLDNQGHIREELYTYQQKYNELKEMAIAQDKNLDYYNLKDRTLVDLILKGIDPPRTAELLGIDINGKDEEEVDALLTDAGYLVRGIDTQCIPFGGGNSSVSMNVDNNFLVIIYDETEYAAAYISEKPEDWTYFPEYWETNSYNANVDISGTTEDNPAYIESYLMNDKVTFKNSEVTPVFTSVKALNVSEDAVQVASKGNGKFEVTFNSNYFDRVLFEIKTATDTYYAVIARSAISVTDNFGPGQENPQLIADVYYATDEYDEDSFRVVATTVDNEGNKETYVVESSDIKEDRWNVDMALWGTSRGKKVEAGKGLSKSRFTIDVDHKGEEIVGVYFNVIGKDELESGVYSGTFSGSGKGSYYDIRERAIVYDK